MGSSVSRRLLSLLAAAAVALPLLASSATPAVAKHHARCTSGASSIRAHVVDGRIVVSPAVTSGCSNAR